MLKSACDIKQNLDEVEILLSTYNGSHFIGQLLNSLVNQSYKNIKIIIRDDGSQDDTVEIIVKFALTYPEIIEVILDGENVGVNSSFLKLLQRSSAKYVMFCDQDDVWLPDKISITLRKMKQMESELGEDKPLLVHTDLIVVDENLQTINNSFWAQQKLNPKLTGLNNLLVRNVVTGCTAMLNRSLVRHLDSIPDGILMYDWWIALVATSLGRIAYIPEQTVLYRQHQGNIVGAKKFSSMDMVAKLLGGEVRKRTLEKQHQAKLFLERYSKYLTKDNHDMLESFSKLCSYSLNKRILLIFRYNFFSNGFLRNLVYCLSMLF